MRFTQLFCPTIKEIPNDAELISHQYLIRAGYIRKVASGIYSYLPLGLKVLNKISNIIREELNRTGAQEIFMPSIIPSDLWQESGRWNQYGKELLRLKDRHNKDFCYAPTHEEVVTDIIRNNIRSYKQLPINLYQIQTKFRDEIRPRFGLMRGREFCMKDAYSFHDSWESLSKTYNIMQKTYSRIFERCGLETKIVEADTGAIGGSISAEFMVVAKSGEDLIIECSNCGYTANLEVASTFSEENQLQDYTQLPAYEKIYTPNLKTIDSLTEFFNQPKTAFIKSIIFSSQQGPVMVLVRGDHEINIHKVIKETNRSDIQLASSEQILKWTQAPEGFSGPVNLSKEILLIADNSIKNLGLCITGANQKDTHLKNVLLNRDFKPVAFYDLRLAEENDICAKCKEKGYKFVRGIEVGHIFQLGRKYSESMNATYLDAQGKEQHYIMGCYGIGVGRTMSAAIEQHHDENGIIWPINLAPFVVDIIVINSKDDELSRYAEEIYQRLLKNGLDVILDDRQDRAGVKFKDADLIGFPFQIVIGQKMKQQGLIEIKNRRTKQSYTISDGELIKFIIQLISDEG